MFKLILVILLILFSESVYNQTRVSVNGKNYYLVDAVVEDGDTIPFIKLREIVILPPKVFTSKKQEQKYLRLVKNIKKVYPYAKLARNKMYEIHNNVISFQTESEKNKYLKVAEKELKNEFEDELKDLTITQGKLLIKLIDRETGQTTYAIVKELRGSVEAFLWQSVARIFGSSLKTEFDSDGEDKMIEDIIVRIDNGQI
ncbi:MAG: hypothetical protein A2033_15370 [Bacteroidetes bacterium GWA2_31_9]|nr:MAG: hypothetical protein A2033_15370 [Bacteroidetes bacterium GWA2_31_9]